MAQQYIVDPVTRIEGHAKIVLDLNAAGEVEKAHLSVLEIRGFEKLLEKMELFKLPQVTARICGVCPAAHHLVSAAAIENGLGISIPEGARKLRQILYAGHMLHSHALSTFFLSGPDLLLGLDAPQDKRNVFNLVGLDPALAKKVLRLRTIGQLAVEMIGGKGVHPVSAIPGGMAFCPPKEKLDQLAGWGKEALDLLEELYPAVMARLALMADVHDSVMLPFHSAAISKAGTLNFLEGEVVVVDPAGQKERTFTAKDYAENLVEHVMPGSYMKAVHLRAPQEKYFFVGPLARFNVNDSMSTPKADAMMKAFHAKGRPSLSALDNVEVRLIEMVHSAEMLATLPAAGISGPINVAAEPKAGRFIGLVEAPRGILIHDYTADDAGRVTAANLIVATQNNYRAIDNAITSLAKLELPKKDDNLLMNSMEFALRCFDPCLSCATHAAGQMPMEVEIRKEGRTVRTVSRRDQP